MKPPPLYQSDGPTLHTVIGTPPTRTPARVVTVPERAVNVPAARDGFDDADNDQAEDDAEDEVSAVARDMVLESGGFTRAFDVMYSSTRHVNALDALISLYVAGDSFCDKFRRLLAGTRLTLAMREATVSRITE